MISITNQLIQLFLQDIFNRMKNLLISSFSFLLFTFSLLAQDKNASIGNEYFSKYDYVKAEKYFSLVKTPDLTVMRGLAVSRFRIGKTNDAEETWSQIATQSGATAEDHLEYARILMFNNKYDAAKKELEVYFKQMPASSITSNFSVVSILELWSKTREVNVTNHSSNSEKQDFSPFLFDNTLFFVSSSRRIDPVKRTWSGNNQPYLDIKTVNPSNGNSVDVLFLDELGINKKLHDGPIAFSPDKKTMIVSRNENNNTAQKNTVQLYFSEKKNDKWGALTPFVHNIEGYSTGHGSITSSGDTLFFTSDRPGGVGGTDIYFCVKQNDNWSNPINLKAVNTERNEMFPFTHSSGLLFFASDGLPGYGGLDNFLVDLSIKNFPPLNLLAPLNTPSDDFAFFVTEDLKNGFFSSNRTGGLGDDDNYSFVSPTEIYKKQINKLILLDDKGEKLSNVTVKICPEDEPCFTAQSNANGEVLFPNTQKTVRITATKPDYSEVQMDIPKNTEVTEVKMRKPDTYQLNFIVMDKESNTPVKDISILFELNGIKHQLVTDEKGYVLLPLTDWKKGQTLQTEILLKGQGVIEKKQPLTFLLADELTIDVHKYIDISITKIKVGGDLAEMIDIKPIFFDLGKSTIRKDAAVELDKIVEVMNKYPDMVVELGSHTDCRSSAASNMTLSSKRAVASADYIKKKITSPDRISGVGYGETKLKNGCECEGAVTSKCTEAEHQENRRTEFRIIKF